MPEYTKYKLYYFDCRAKGELIRILFEIAGVEYENIRIPKSEWESRYKKELNLPFGQIPVLSIDGAIYPQTLCIARYLAEEFGLAGKTPLERLRVDTVAHCADDFAVRPINIYREKNEKIQAEQLAKFRDDEMHVYLGYLENMLKENNGGDGYFVGDSLTWADVTFYVYVEMPSLLKLDVASYLEAYPKLKGLYHRVERIPAVASWIARRPNDPF